MSLIALTTIHTAKKGDKIVQVIEAGKEFNPGEFDLDKKEIERLMANGSVTDSRREVVRASDVESVSSPAEK